MAERITGHTELIGLMAYPIRHSSSPAMHNEAFATLGLDYAYLAFEVDNDTLEDAVKGLRALKMVGSNVSMPNKTVVGQYLDELSPAAEMAGAVNTIVNDNGKLIGHITDGIGYMQSLKDNDIIRITINSDHNPLVIGQKGMTLQALNELVKAAVNTKFQRRFRILLDVENYKERKYRHDIFIAKREAKKVLTRQMSIALDPMPADERKQIHNALAKMPHISTESEGDGPNRHIVIRYKDED